MTDALQRGKFGLVEEFMLKVLQMDDYVKRVQIIL